MREGKIRRNLYIVSSEYTWIFGHKDKSRHGVRVRVLPNGSYVQHPSKCVGVAHTAHTSLMRVLTCSLRYHLVSGKPCSTISIRYLMRIHPSSGVNHDILLLASFYDSLPAIHWRSASQLTQPLLHKHEMKLGCQPQGAQCRTS